VIGALAGAQTRRVADPSGSAAWTPAALVNDIVEPLDAYVREAELTDTR